MIRNADLYAELAEATRRGEAAVYGNVDHLLRRERELRDFARGLLERVG